MTAQKETAFGQTTDPHAASMARWAKEAGCALPVTREALEAENARLRAALVRCRDVGLGPDRGTASWQIGVVEQIATEALENVR